MRGIVRMRPSNGAVTSVCSPSSFSIVRVWDARHRVRPYL